MNKRIATLLALLGVSQHLSAQQKQELASALQQAAPGAAAAVVSSGAQLMGLQLNEWLVVSSIAFVVLQAGYLTWKWRRDYRRDAERKAQGRPWPASDTDMA